MSLFLAARVWTGVVGGLAACESVALHDDAVLLAVKHKLGHVADVRRGVFGCEGRVAVVANSDCDGFGLGGREQRGGHKRRQYQS